MVLLSYYTGAKSSSFEDDLEDKYEQQQRWSIERWRREEVNVQQRVCLRSVSYLLPTRARTIICDLIHISTGKIGRDLAPKLSKPPDYLVGIGLLLLVTYEL
jgi:hypothetical protein